MKSWKIAAVCVAGTLAAIAADMTGDYNTWLGYIAGINADGERTTVQGAGAGGEASGLIRTDLIGAAAGAYSTNLTDCVGIGYRALRGSADMSEVVAIGAGAFSNKVGLSKATWLNGHFAAFGQNNTFWIKANPKQADTNAPIHFANGVLSLNADTVRINGETAGGGGGGTSAPILTGYDLYVDPVNGDDTFSGTSPGAAKRTIDGALLAEGQRIALLAGEYSVPTNVKGMTCYFYAPYGKKYTKIKGVRSDKYGLQVGYIENCTLENLIGNSNGYPSFCGIASNCTIKTTSVRSTNMAVLYSQVYDSDIECLWDREGDQGQRSMFIGSDIYNSIIYVYSTNGFKPSFSSTYSSAFENCFISATNLGYFAYSSSASLNNCTVLIPENAPTGSLKAYNSLVGYGDEAVTLQGTNNICEAYTTIASHIGMNYRPAVTDWRYYFHGYKSATERAIRDGMESSIVNALLANDELDLPQAATMKLMNMIAENEAFNAQPDIHHNTNSVPFGEFACLPVEEEEE